MENQNQSRHSIASSHLPPREIESYELLEQVGEGTYGKVFRAKDKNTKEIVALKMVKTKDGEEGFPITTVREIKILKELKHKNIIRLKDLVCSAQNSLYMVFEYMEHDLGGLMIDRTSGYRNLATPQIKCLFKQLLEGLHHCHDKGIIHRDVKSSNLLINDKGELKIADLGLSRVHTNPQLHPYTNSVVTLWYRPPELLMGATTYGPEIDMWSAGCILAELVAGKPIFPGKDEIDQLGLIFDLCGSPNRVDWPGCDDPKVLPHWNRIRPNRPIGSFRSRLQKFIDRSVDSDTLDLLEKLLTLNPANRISAHEALSHDYFWNEASLPCSPEQLPKVRVSSHEYEAKKRRQEMQPVQPFNGRPPLPSHPSHDRRDHRDPRDHRDHRDGSHRQHQMNRNYENSRNDRDARAPQVRDVPKVPRATTRPYVKNVSSVNQLVRERTR